MLEVYLRLLEQDYFELGGAFKGLRDENVWKRPAQGLLSVGELAGHIIYWESTRLAGNGHPEDCKVKSPLIDSHFRYYTPTLDTAPSDEHHAMTAEQVRNEMVRVH